MNRVILMGRLTKDPELSQTPSGVSVVRFSIAVNRRFAKEGQQQADFISIVAWRTTAEFVAKYFKKGSMIAIVGSIQTRSWKDKDGKTQYATDVIADEVYFTGEKKEASGYTSQPAPQEDCMQAFSGEDFTESDYDDDLPF